MDGMYACLYPTGGAMEDINVLLNAANAMVKTSLESLAARGPLPGVVVVPQMQGYNHEEA
ncbi:hypothetical protein PGTUg99_030709 [Puccinia graminis f. sp. tritici]|uniref:Uncharacterized protein n=1 Tax=Puccinia graminis f. sp. tritici TaxID=56615 RepID=A0A5B0N5G4_PUCGR|nr:hypothetical protein PGTUg99_030709 [Puccinia graminis f. sp. tritici]